MQTNAQGRLQLEKEKDQGSPPGKSAPPSQPPPPPEPEFQEDLTDQIPPKSVTSSQTMASLALQRISQSFPAAQEPQEEMAGLTIAERLELTNKKAKAAADPVQAARLGSWAPCELTGGVIHDLYHIEGILARGGMGQVLACTRMRDNLLVVMKLMLAEAETRDVAYQRFMQECKVTHNLRHPNIIKVYDYGIVNPDMVRVDDPNIQLGFKPFLVMELVEGRSLRQVFKERGQLDEQEIGRILIQTCEGLAVVHEKNIIHRDLKPENIMIRGLSGAADNVKLLDFGIAQLQRENRFDEQGMAIGSLGFMSPEQLCGGAVDARTDIYALGLIFYEALTGHPPFKGKTPRETMAMHVQTPHVPPSQLVTCYNAELIDRICTLALAKNANQRYQDVREVQRDLELLIK